MKVETTLTTARPLWPPLVMAATGWPWQSFPLALLDFFAAFCFPCVLGVTSCNLVLKSLVLLLPRDDLIILSSFHHFRLDYSRLEGERANWRWRLQGFWVGFATDRFKRVRWAILFPSLLLSFISRFLCLLA